jgi:FKBP-type peptidyl-prolyl cis-trans isomerase FklB
MKKTFIALACCLAAFSANAQTKKPASKKPVAKVAAKPAAPALMLKNTLDSASYSFGSSMGTGLKSNGITALNYDLLLKGLKDAFAGKEPMLDRMEAQEAINTLFMAKSKAKFAAAIEEGKAFLENNKKVDGVKTTASGLQYFVVKAGNGPKPSADATVLVNYKGRLLNGKQFDSNEGRDPIELSVNGVIPGWTEGLQLMNEGSTYRFFIPYDLAYGERGAGQNIMPYSTLIFEVELVKVK